MAVAIPLWLILAFATGAFTWRLAIVGHVILAALWVVNMARAPWKHDVPPSPHENLGDWDRWLSAPVAIDFPNPTASEGS